MIELTDDQAQDFRVGYRAGLRLAVDGQRLPPAEYYGDGWSKWHRAGWIIGNDDGVQGHSPTQAGERARALGLPATTNPWRPDELGHADHMAGWINAQPAALRWAVSA